MDVVLLLLRCPVSRCIQQPTMCEISRCTCSRNGPKTVDFKWLTSKCDDDDAVSVEMVVVPDTLQSATSNVLFRNLEHFGWSPICLRWNDKALESPSGSTSTLKLSMEAWKLLSQYAQWKKLHAELFESNFITHYLNGNIEKSLRFIPFESGASGSTVAEAKQSWEYSRTTSKCNDTSHLAHLRLRAWTELFHAVIWQVVLELKLPTTNLIVPHKASVEDSHGGNESLDLLRAFRYEPTAQGEINWSEQEPLNPSQIGSSPHTDWGSWTVVWQDDTDPPCLQTYCPECQQWNSVPLPSSSVSQTSAIYNSQECRNKACFIVHVGDLTSLCLRQAVHDMSISLLKRDVVPIARDIWPSPRHRVISPIHQQYRHSLVYFVYPPATATPATITGSLLDWCACHYFDRLQQTIYEEKGYHKGMNKRTSLMNIDWKHYSILADQSSLSVKSDPIALPRRWCDMQCTLVGNILQEKWREVQR
jgi:hypothetical protein